MDFLLSLAILVTGVGALFIAGLPISQLAFFPNHRNLSTPLQRDALWGIAPLVGYAVISFLLRLFVFINVPIKYVAWPVLIFLILVFIGWLFLTYNARAARLHNRLRLVPKITPSRWFVIVFLAFVAIYSISYLMVGANQYRGTGQWDNIFLGFRAEAYRTYSLQEMNELVDTKSFLFRTTSDNGAHRVSIHLLQAFIAAICGIDGVRANGIMIILCSVLCFCGVLYATKQTTWSSMKRYTACVFAASLPSYTKAAVEVFIGSCFVGAILFACCTLLSEIIEKPSLLKSAVLSLLIAVVFTTYSVGVYYILAIAIITYIVLALKKKIPARNVIYLLGSFVFSAVLVLPYLTGLFVELGAATEALPGLEILYPYVIGAGGLTATFWGTVFSGDLLILFNVFGLLAILLLLVSLIGLLYGFLGKNQASSLCFLALLVTPAIFWAYPYPKAYNYYRSFTMVAPLLVVGIFFFWDCIKETWLPKILNYQQRAKAARTKKTILFAGGSGLFALGLASLIASYAFTMAIPYHDKYQSDDIYRLAELDTTFSDESFAFYQQLEELHDQNILLIAPDYSAVYVWANYYGRNNILYGLVDNVDDWLFFDQENPLVEYENIPLDALIIEVPCYNWPHINFVPEEYRKDMAAQIQTVNSSGKWFTLEELHKEPPEVFEFYDKYQVTFFSRKAQNVILRLSLYNVAQNTDEGLDVFAEYASFKVGDKVYSNVRDGDVIDIPLGLRPGGSRFEVECLDDSMIALADWELLVA